jgi:hypothetical protein
MLLLIVVLAAAGVVIAAVRLAPRRARSASAERPPSTVFIPADEGPGSPEQAHGQVLSIATERPNEVYLFGAPALLDGYGTTLATTPLQLAKHEAQASADRWCVEVADLRERDGSTVGALADAEPLLALPETVYPAEVLEVRTVAANALVSLWGNRYSVPPGLVGGQVQVRWRLGAETFVITPAA